MKSGISILLVEDEQSLGSIIAENLEAAGFIVEHVMTAAEALVRREDQVFGLMILDVMLPDMNGFDLARRIRRNDTTTPILFLTSKTMPQDVVDGFESGGNDYLRKPFSMQELIIRIRVLSSEGRLLQAREAPSPVRIGMYTFDPVKQQLTFEFQTLPLTARESELLWMLYEHRQQLSSKKEILENIWGDDNFFNSRTLDVFITRLRKHLRFDPGVQIINVRGVGYKLVW